MLYGGYNVNFPDSDIPFTTITLLCWKESTILLNTCLRKVRWDVVEVDH
ncbi:unnamed protein product [Brassica oleracea]